MLSLTYCSYGLANLGFVTCFFMWQVNLCWSWIRVFQKYLYDSSFDDTIAINFSEKKDSLGFKRFDLFGGFSPFCDVWMLEQQEILRSWKDAIMRITLCWSPYPLLDLLTYSLQPSLGSLESLPPPHFPSLSGRPPTSETLDSAGSALSTKFRKPLATSNHYFRKRERAMHGGGETTKEWKRTRERTRHTQKQREIRFLLFSVTPLQ